MRAQATCRASSGVLAGQYFDEQRVPVAPGRAVVTGDAAGGLVAEVFALVRQMRIDQQRAVFADDFQGAFQRFVGQGPQSARQQQRAFDDGQDAAGLLGGHQVRQARDQGVGTNGRGPARRRTAA